jgi:hypothetical protein
VPYGGGGGVPAGYWTPQNGARSPLYINTREVHVYGGPHGPYDGGDGYGGGGGSGERRRSGGFFRPAFEAVGHFFDRRFGFHSSD